MLLMTPSKKAVSWFKHHSAQLNVERLSSDQMPISTAIHLLAVLGTADEIVREHKTNPERETHEIPIGGLWSELAVMVVVTGTLRSGRKAG